MSYLVVEQLVTAAYAAHTVTVGWCLIAPSTRDACALTFCLLVSSAVYAHT